MTGKCWQNATSERSSRNPRLDEMGIIRVEGSLETSDWMLARTASSCLPFGEIRHSCKEATSACSSACTYPTIFSISNGCPVAWHQSTTHLPLLLAVPHFSAYDAGKVVILSWCPLRALIRKCITNDWPRTLWYFRSAYMMTTIWHSAESNQSSDHSPQHDSKETSGPCISDPSSGETMLNFWHKRSSFLSFMVQVSSQTWLCCLLSRHFLRNSHPL